MSNNLNSKLAMFYIVTFIASLSFLETNILSTFAQTDNILLITSKLLLPPSTLKVVVLIHGYVSQNSVPRIAGICQMLQVQYIGLAAGPAIGGVISWWIYTISLLRSLILTTLFSFLASPICVISSSWSK